MNLSVLINNGIIMKNDISERMMMLYNENKRDGVKFRLLLMIISYMWHSKDMKLYDFIKEHINYSRNDKNHFAFGITIDKKFYISNESNKSSKYCNKLLFQELKHIPNVTSIDCIIIKYKGQSNIKDEASKLFRRFKYFKNLKEIEILSINYYK